MELLLGVIGIFFAWAIAAIGIIFGAFYLLSRGNRPKPAKPVVAAPTPKAPPLYVRRWGTQRKHWEATEHAGWDKDFERLLHL